MVAAQEKIAQLEERVRSLEEENAKLRAGGFPDGATVRVPESFAQIFESAQETVREYFGSSFQDPTKGTIQIADERYVLVRAASLSRDFLDTIQRLYADRGAYEALRIGKNLLFDLAHVIGMNDAQKFHERMGLTDPVSKLAAGPVHFAYSGWAFVEILPESNPTPDDNFFLYYHHPFAFESDAWLRAGEETEFTVCIMNAGYSSGWCEESFGLPLTSVEIACKARGDENCTFVMAPPHRLRDHVRRLLGDYPESYRQRILQDIPSFFERKKTEESMRGAIDHAEAASRAKSQFLANMSHEIRTPLNGLLGFTRLLLETPLDQEQRDFVQMINRSGSALLRILNDVLDLSKIEAGSMNIVTMPCSVQKVLEEVAAILQAEIGDKDLELAIAVEKIPQLILDRARLGQILFNLAGNAVKFTEQGRIELRADWTARSTVTGTLEIAVADTGIGMAEADLERVFDEFTQVDASSTREHAGTGLGLSISKKLVELMGGRVEVESELGKGSTFRIQIPAKAFFDPEEPKVKSPSRAPSFSTLFAGRVLIVEDNTINQIAARKLLERFGLEVEVVTSGADAIDMLMKQRFDLVLMDLQMPVMDGYETSRIIRRIEPPHHTPIVAFSAAVTDEEQKHCREAGMDDFLEKPLSIEQMESILIKWLSKPTD